MTFELCVPAHNEAEIITDALVRLRSVLSRADLQDWSITVADNASDDGTADKVRLLGDTRITAVRTEQKGKGSAVIDVARRSSHEAFGFIDADLSASPDDLPLLLAVIMGDEADIVIGSRLLDARLVNRSPLRSASSRVFNGLRRLLLGIDVSDSQCGLKIMNVAGREVLGSCVETGWFFDMEFLARAERAGLRIREMPVHWNEEEFNGRHSKLRLMRDGFGAIAAMVRMRARLARS